MFDAVFLGVFKERSRPDGINPSERSLTSLILAIRWRASIGHFDVGGKKRSGGIFCREGLRGKRAESVKKGARVLGSCPPVLSEFLASEHGQVDFKVGSFYNLANESDKNTYYKNYNNYSGNQQWSRSHSEKKLHF